jgi:hypothetical protein
MNYFISGLGREFVLELDTVYQKLQESLLLYAEIYRGGTTRGAAALPGWRVLRLCEGRGQSAGCYPSRAQP